MSSRTRWPQFERIRRGDRARAFLAGAGPAAIGAILGASIPLAGALRETWQFAVLAAAAIALLIARRGIVVTLLGAGIVGTVIALAGGPVPRNTRSDHLDERSQRCRKIPKPR